MKDFIQNYTQVGDVKYYHDLEQGTDEWLEARLGILTASEMKLIITPTLKSARNDKERAHVFDIISQRVTGVIEPSYQGWDMVRGNEDEYYARQAYVEKFAPVQECGFVTTDRYGFTIGYSPDGLVGDDGLIEIKSRSPKLQFKTVLEHIADRDGDLIPPEFMLQHQTALLVTERKWIDFNSFSNGLPMVTIRVHPIPEYFEAIIAAATAFELRVQNGIQRYNKALAVTGNMTPTERFERESGEILV